MPSPTGSGARGSAAVARSRAASSEYFCTRSSRVSSVGGEFAFDGIDEAADFGGDVVELFAQMRLLDALAVPVGHDRWIRPSSTLVRRRSSSSSMASFSASSCSRWPLDCSTTFVVSARTVLMRASASAMRASASMRSFWRSLAASSLRGERGAELGGGGGGIRAAFLGAFELGDQRLVLLFEETGALALGVELAEHGIHVAIVVAAQRLAVELDGLGQLAAQSFARGLELRGLVGIFAVAHAQALGQVGAFLLEVEDAAAQFGLALLELAHLLQMIVALVADRADFGALAVDVAELVGQAAAQRLDIHFEPAGREREFGAQLILVGAELRHGDGGRGLDALFGEADGAAPDGGHDGQCEEACGRAAPTRNT